jgi:hypothetical protein
MHNMGSISSPAEILVRGLFGDLENSEISRCSSLLFVSGCDDRSLPAGSLAAI